LRLVEVKCKTKQFLKKRNSPLAEFRLNEMCLVNLCNWGPGDVFCYLNKLNRSLQRFCTNTFALKNRTAVFIKKLALQDSFAQKGYAKLFSTKQLLISSDVKC